MGGKLATGNRLGLFKCRISEHPFWYTMIFHVYHGGSGKIVLIDLP